MSFDVNVFMGGLLYYRYGKMKLLKKTYLLENLKNSLVVLSADLHTISN